MLARNCACLSLHLLRTQFVCGDDAFSKCTIGSYKTRHAQWLYFSETMKKLTSARRRELTQRRRSPLITPTDLGAQASTDIAGSMNAVLADIFALYLKTKNFHWHMSGPHFRDYHLLLDEQADQLYAMTDPDRGENSQNGRLNLALHRAHRASATNHRQRRGLRRSARHARGASR